LNFEGRGKKRGGEGKRYRSPTKSVLAFRGEKTNEGGEKLGRKNR